MGVLFRTHRASPAFLYYICMLLRGRVVRRSDRTYCSEAADKQAGARAGHGLAQHAWSFFKDSTVQHGPNCVRGLKQNLPV